MKFDKLNMSIKILIRIIGFKWEQIKILWFSQTRWESFISLNQLEQWKEKETETEHFYNYRIAPILHNITLISIIWLNTRGFVYTESDGASLLLITCEVGMHFTLPVFSKRKANFCSTSLETKSLRRILSISLFPLFLPSSLKVEWLTWEISLG